ncbi:MAG: membrane protein insertase YidC [Bacteroidales bacterium]|nr:membrane protein insertase YidC [Bacteroidales bacterium]
MDRNTIIGLGLIFVVFVGWSIWQSPSKEELEKRRHSQDSVAIIHQKISDSVALITTAAKLNAENNEDQTIEATLKTISQDSASKLLQEKFGFFGTAAAGKKGFTRFGNELLNITLVNQGGRPYEVKLIKYQTWDTLPLILFDSIKSKFGLQFFAGKRNINTNELYFKPHVYTGVVDAEGILRPDGEIPAKVGMRLYADRNDADSLQSYVEFVYTMYPNQYMLDFDIRLNKMGQIIEQNTSFINLLWTSELNRHEQSLDNEINETTVYYRDSRNEDVDYLSERKDDKKNLPTNLKWISFKSKFFVSTLIAKEAFPSAEIESQTKASELDNPHYLRTLSAVIPLEYGQKQQLEYPMQLYFGPNKYKTLKKFDLKLERQIPLGWSFILMWAINIYAVIPVFDWLNSYNINFGIIILILTIMLKIVLFPIAYISYKSSAKMKVLKPDIDELGKKFPKKEDAMKKQQATMELYKKAGVNPMAGCIPMLLQFPILLAMFRFFPSSIELRQEAFLWAHDLSSYDSIMSLPFNIPFYGDHVSLFTLLMTVSTLLYTKMNNDMMSSSQQLPGMKTMMYLMPIMFLGIFNNFSSGLSYYYFLANMITFGQMLVIKRTINEDKLRARIAENQKKTIKKSSFQKKLEEMAKQKNSR